MADEPQDCVIVGGGPAGLTAAIYLGRFRRKVVVIDNGKSRVLSIAYSYNVAGFSEGISGRTLLGRMRRHAKRYNVKLSKGTVNSVVRGSDAAGHTFTVKYDGKTCTARTLLLAAGIYNIEPDVPGIVGPIEKGIFRPCPICDGYESMDQAIAVIGHTESAAREAMFLLTYTRDLHILTLGKTPEWPDSCSAELAAAGIQVLTASVKTFRLAEKRKEFQFADEGVKSFDTVYAATGTLTPRRLIDVLGLATDGQGCVNVRDHQRTSVRGVFAAGDVVAGLDQINAAVGQGAVAGTAIHNYLRGALPWS
jgi:thioredoxin reductase (NADPH)